MVIVLSFVVLCTILVVAFFANVTTEGVGERAAASETSASQLALSAVQLVEGTITNATEPQSDTSVAWASQPGMIRTYGGTASALLSDPLNYYKLYSSDNMIVAGKALCNTFTTTGQAAEVPQYWDKAPSLFTDLNAPLTTGPGAPIFPILDPRAADLGVEGFANNATSSTLDGTIATTGTFGSDSGSRLPMPVRWMYVLRDGTMTVPDTPTASGLSSTAITSVSWSKTAVNVPTAANPIVGRVAFWTDDESAKVNVNTASEGTYQDSPLCNSGSSSDVFTYPPTTALGDYVLARLPGVQHEYQRYPGHPATTCLSSVFGNSLAGLSRKDLVKSITDVVPRIQDYPSTTTTAAGTTSGASSMGGTQVGATSTPALMTDFDRLYANLDEFQFTPTRATPNLQATQTSVEQNLVDSCRFFVTAHSKAPELNMFGLPRVAMWPLWDTALVSQATLTPFDQEILRCSTVTSGLSSSGGVPHSFAFFRANALSATADFPASGSPSTGIGVQRNHQVFAYLQNLLARPVPGFGNSFASKYNSAPSGPTDSDQILTEIFDYIRSTNLADNSSVTIGTTTTNAVPYTGTYGPSGNVGATSIASSSQNASPGQVVPIQISVSGGTTQGFGRIATIGEMVLVLMKVDDRKDTGAAPGGTNYASTVTVQGPGAGSISSVNPAKQTLMEWCLIPKMVSPMCGYVALANDIRLVFSNGGGSPLTIGSTTVDLSTASNIYDSGRLSCNERDSVIGGNIGAESLVEYSYATFSRQASGSPSDSMYPTGLCLVDGGSQTSPPTPAPSTTTMPISGSFTVQLYAPAGSSAAAAGTPLQTYTFTIPPNTTVPIPQVSVSGTSWFGTFRAAGQTGGPGGGTQTSAYKTQTSGTTVSGTFTYPASTPPSFNKGAIGRLSQGYRNYLGGSDVIRSLVPMGPLSTGGAVNVLGDIRVVASSPTSPASVWQLTLTSAGTAPTSTTGAADSACLGVLAPFPGSAYGQVSPLIAHNKYVSPPEVPPLPGGNTAAVTMPAPGNQPADWDNGPGLMPDGPWMNKPDEGTGAASGLPYIGNYETMVFQGATLSTQFSPNRQVSSPVMFGSLLTGADHPWRTLLFRPATLPGYQGGYTHPGNSNPATSVPDHLLLDLFWMPVVEPYGISEPLATSGKINLNTQITPFTYINRTTGMNAVLKSVMITALNPDGSNGIANNSFKFVKSGNNSYKTATTNVTYGSATTRYPIDATQTLAQLTNSSDTTSAFPDFARKTHSVTAPNFFVSPSQICDVPLIPVSNATSLAGFWGANSLTGDNSLERPYSLIYPRVTTKSNIFTVHVRAQTLKKIATDPNQASWNEAKDQVLSDYRGSYTIEKYFDPNNDDITTDTHGTVASASNDGSISQTAAIRNTKWRLLNAKRFGQ